VELEYRWNVQVGKRQPWTLVDTPTRMLPVLCAARCSTAV
jgi:hypothetical protein